MYTTRTANGVLLLCNVLWADFYSSTLDAIEDVGSPGSDDQVEPDEENGGENKGVVAEDEKKKTKVSIIFSPLVFVFLL